MQAYITSISNISPQPTFDLDTFPGEVVGQESKFLACIEPDYRNFINPIQLRRMPRILKMALASSQMCINHSPVASPDGIIVGTGLGCLENLEKFLLSIIEDNEHVLSVLPFINSTHNAVAAQIAMLLKNHSYNTTYCHRGFSFESALTDAMMLLEDNEANHVLVGGIDECTPNFVFLHNYLGYWKDPVDNLQLLQYKTPGTIAGEGSAFFMLSNEPTDNTYAKLQSVSTGFALDNKEVIAQLDLLLQNAGLGITDLDLVIFGMNGDVYFDEIYHQLQNSYFDSSSVYGYYKHLCGDYYTSTAFALWLVSIIIRNQSVPAVVRLNAANRKQIRHVLIYNHIRNKEHSMILVSSKE
jgi:3-oxoacyl-[acyl-carrier-protein] synthase II